VKRMKAVVDTNVIIYDYVVDSERHKEAERLLDALDKWIIPVIVVHELFWFFKGLSLDAKIEDIEAYIRHEKAEVVCDCESNVAMALDILRKEKLSISRYKDMVILSHAAMGKYPIATFDIRLSKVARRLGVETVPLK
jgi:predicted nucleic acid-binding protein